MTVTEALAIGTAVVVVDPDIASELPEGQVTVSKDRSPEALARAIESAIDASREAQGDLRAQRTSFLQSTLTNQMISLYESVIAR
jgi:hypothetical protein